MCVRACACTCLWPVSPCPVPPSGCVVHGRCVPLVAPPCHGAAGHCSARRGPPSAAAARQAAVHHHRPGEQRQRGEERSTRRGQPDGWTNYRALGCASGFAMSHAEVIAECSKLAGTPSSQSLEGARCSGPPGHKPWQQPTRPE